MTDESTREKAVGRVHIAENVIAIIASISATSVKGVAGMSGGIAGGFTEALGKKNLSKGIKVDIKDDVITINLTIVVDYGYKIPDISWEVQDVVKNMVETMTAMTVCRVDIHVQAVRFPEDDKQKNPADSEDNA